MNIIVAKFGGTSMGNASSLQSVAEIVSKNTNPITVVVSATSGTTDELIALANSAMKKGQVERGVTALIQKHEVILSGLGVSLDLNPFWEEIGKVVQGIQLISELSPSIKDRLLSFGERISSFILAALLNQKGIKAVPLDAYNFIFTNNHFGEGKVDFKKTAPAIEKQVLRLLKKGIVPVITGFIGQSESGQYITLGRGGSDYSAALIASALHASELQIWTDVDGILNTDPRLIPGAKVLAQLSFNEASELAYFGAKVLHPKTIRPAVQDNIPVRILNTFNPGAHGTLITTEKEESIKSVTYKKNITIINICSVGMLEAFGFLAKIFDVFARYNIIVDVVSTSEVSVSLTVDAGISEEVIAELETFAHVTVHPKKAIVCLVGEGIRSKKGILGTLFSAVEEYDIEMVSQGASQRNITFLVNEIEAPDVVKKIFNIFFNKSQ